MRICAIAVASALVSLKMRMFFAPPVDSSRSRIIRSIIEIDSRGAETMIVLVRRSGVSEIASRMAAETSISTGVTSSVGGGAVAPFSPF